MMTDAITVGTILIEKGARMPASLGLESAPYSSGWTSVSNMDRKELDRELDRSGWTFFFMAGEMKITAIGRDREAAVRRAVNRVITNVESHKCNCLEITQVSAHSFLGVPYVSVCAHARHIQEGAEFSGGRQ
jgi:hypothetical protein